LNSEFGKMLRQQRHMIELTLGKLAAKSGVSTSHLARIEKGNRFPSAGILRKIAEPLHFGETELLILAGYLSPEHEAQPSNLDPYVARALAQEPADVQRAVVGIVTLLRRMEKEQKDMGFAEYAHRRYPQLDDDVITMIENIMEHPPEKGEPVQER